MRPRFLPAFLAGILLAAAADAQIAARARRRLIIQTVDASARRVLAGNTRPEVATANDAGAVASDFAMDHMLLQLRRPAELAQALDARLARLQDPASPEYHRWLTPADIGQQYGPAQADVDEIAAWLRSQGFTVNGVYPSGMTIDFSGTASQVASAFHTEIHHLDVNGKRHVANVSDPSVPAALAPAVAGVVSMHDFTPRPLHKARPQFTIPGQTSTHYAVTPGDLATIYNLNPLFAAGITGKGQTIAVIEDADLYDPADWDTFRTTFGLSQYTNGSLASVHPQAPGVGSNCLAPGRQNGDDVEAALDAEWASAAAPDAAVQVAACAHTRTTYGLLIALQNIVNGAGRPGLLSISYGQCEPYAGAALNAAFRDAYQQAAAEGISVFVASGDEGAAACDAGASGASHGIAVNGFASTAYNVAAGGTDFADTYTKTKPTYWSADNGPTYTSALSYIPEIPWNDSCASGLLADYLGFSTSFGAGGLCDSPTARQYGLLEVAAGGGGPSGCATGAPSRAGTVSGTCQGHPKPDWQQGVAGVPADGVRDLPDVSLFAGSGVWGHWYVFCYSNTQNGGAPCTGDPAAWAGAGALPSPRRFWRASRRS